MSGSPSDPSAPDPSQPWTGDTVLQGWTGDTVIQNPSSSQAEVTQQIPSYTPNSAAAPAPRQEFQRGSVPDKHQRLIGTPIDDQGRYRIEQHLGGGGMGEVYRASDTTLGRQVAIKILTAFTPGGDPAEQDLIDVTNQNLLKRFQREVAVCAPLINPNIVQVTDMGLTSAGLPFYVMEYLQGKTLGQVMEQEGPLDLERALRILIQVCEGLKGAHQSGVVHRDLKPDNIFLLPGVLGEWVKILDFGIAKVIQDDRPDQTNLTGLGFFVGTFQYAAPEQCLEGLPITQRTDIYSLGAVMYEMISGTNPFGLAPDDARSTYRWLESHVRVKPLPLRDHPPCRGVPPQLEETVMRCLEKAPEDRFPSVDELSESLKQVLYDIAPPTTPLGRQIPSSAPSVSTPSRPVVPTPPSRSYVPSPDPSPHPTDAPSSPTPRRRFPGIVILLGLAGCIALAWFLLRDRFSDLGDPTESTPDPTPQAQQPDTDPITQALLNWCNQATSDPALAHTLGQLATTVNAPSCTAAAPQLARLDTLNLNEQSITDLRPLSALIALQHLDLSGNQITDLTPLTDLPRLQTLNLSRNQITDASPLTDLTTLTNLNLLGNPQLQPLNLPDNPNPTCPLPDPQDQICVSL